MVKVVEIPVLTASDQVLELLIQDQKVETLDEWPDIRFMRLNLDDAQAIFYLIQGSFEANDFTIGDLVIPKAPFVWILFEKDDLAFDTVLKKYTTRYLTPFYLLTAQNLKPQIQSKRITEDQLLAFDPEDPQRLQQALLNTLKIRLVEENQLSY